METATMAAKPIRVFVGHHQSDRRWVERLMVHLAQLRRERSVTCWDETKIEPGAQWRSEIAAAVADAEVAVLFLSADYIASRYIADGELPTLLAAAESKGLKILQVIASACTVPESLAKYQAVNTIDRPLAQGGKHYSERLFADLTEMIQRLAVERESRASAPVRPPADDVDHQHQPLPDRPEPDGDSHERPHLEMARPPTLKSRLVVVGLGGLLVVGLVGWSWASTIRALRGENAALVAANRALSEEANAKNQVIDLQRSLTESEERMRRLRLDVELAERQREEVEVCAKDVADKKAQLETMRSKDAKTQQEINQVRDRLASLSARLAVVATQSHQDQATIAELRRRLDVLKATQVDLLRVDPFDFFLRSMRNSCLAPAIDVLDSMRQHGDSLTLDCSAKPKRCVMPDIPSNPPTGTWDVEDCCNRIVNALCSIPDYQNVHRTIPIAEVMKKLELRAPVK